MSRWMDLQGKITYIGDPISVEGLIVGDDLPTGSEGPITYGFYQHEHTSAVHISIDGSLRDCGWQEDIDNVRRWFTRITQSASVPHAFIEMRAGSVFRAMFVCGLYFHDGVFTELTIPPGFIDLDDPVLVPPTP